MLIDVLTGLLVVGAVGVIAAVLLSVASYFFHVDEDETAANIRSVLPGANCGACGYAGCDDYAKAIAEGKCKTNLCIPGGDSTAAEIAEILGIAAEDVKEMVAFVHCNGNREATSDKMIYDGVSTCRAASMLYGGPGECRFGCLGCGDCAGICPQNAICIKDGIARIDARLCIGCGLCARTCPKGIISMIPQIAKVAVACSNEDKGALARKACKNACIACKKCENTCEFGAIKVENNLARINYDKCTNCGACAKVCPTHCIVEL